MAKLKVDPKALLMQKGERIGLVVGAVFMVLLMVFGIMAAFENQNPAEVAANLNQGKSQIQTKIERGPTPPPEKLPDWVGESTDKLYEKIDPTKYASSTPFFDPTFRDDNRRRNPGVMTPSEFQLALVRGQVLSYDVFVGADKKPRIAVIREKQIKQNEQEQVQTVKKRFKKNPYLVPGTPGYTPVPTPGPGVKPPEPAAPAVDGALGKVESTIEYVLVEKLGEQAGQQERLAETIHPVRMVQVTGSFPYKAQLEEYVKALRLSTIDDLARTTDPASELAPGIPRSGAAGAGRDTAGLAPKFLGFNVQRQVRSLATGEVLQKFAPYDWKEASRRYYSLAVSGEPEDEKLVPVTLPGLTWDRPKLARAKYPEVHLPKIDATLAKIDEASAADKNKKPNPLLEQFQGKGDEAFNLGGRKGVSGTEGAAPVPPPVEPAPMAGQAQTQEPPEFLLMRFLDTGVEPGRIYDYKIQIVMSNPNFGKKNLVTQPSYAEKEKLESGWADAGSIAVPPEAFLYAIDKGKDVDNKPQPTKPAYFAGDPTAHTTVQMQRWFDRIRLDVNETVPWNVGDWVVADLAVRPGEHIGYKAEVELPLWMATLGSYIIKDPKTFRTKTGPGTRPKIVTTTRPTVKVDFGTESILVDLEGGTGDYHVPLFPAVGPTGQKKPDLKVNDKAGTELLILRPDGQLVVRNSAVDEKNADRERRAADWENWVKETKDKAQPNDPMKPGGEFTKPMGKP